MAKTSLGLVNIYMGPVGTNGAMGTALAKVGYTVPGTATLTTEDNQTTDFFIEEATAAVDSIISQEGKKTFGWSSSDVSPYQLKKFFGGTLLQFKTIATFGTIVPGTGYTNGVYYDVPLTGGSGVNAIADVTVAGGVVTVVALRNGGEAYTASDSLSAANTNMGGTGSGFSVPVSTLANGSATESTWEAPSSNITLTQSLRIEGKKGFVVEIPKAQISAKFNFSFTKDKQSQIDMVATVLLPDNPAVGQIKVRSYTA